MVLPARVPDAHYTRLFMLGLALLREAYYFKGRLVVAQCALVAVVSVGALQWLRTLVSTMLDYAAADAHSLVGGRLLAAFVALLFALYVLAPIGLLWRYRVRATRRKMERELADARLNARRNYVADEFANASCAVTFFFPDLLEDDTSVAAYTGAAGFAAPAQRMRCTHLEPASIIATPLALVFPDVEVRPVARARWWWRLLAWLQAAQAYLLRAELRTKPDRVTVPACAPLSLAQRPDVERALAFVRDAMNAEPRREHTPFVLFGVGRGANVALEVAARLPREYRRHIKGLVLEGLVTDADRIAAVSRSYLAANPDDLAHDPVDVARSFPDQLPLTVLLVHSYSDALVDTGRLHTVKRFLQAKGVDVRSVRLARSRHGHYTHDDAQETLTYEEAALHFYLAIENAAHGDKCQ